MATRDIRIKLTGKVADSFDKAKAIAEKELGFALRDNEFAARVVTAMVQAVPVTVNKEPPTGYVGSDLTMEQSIQRQAEITAPSDGFIRTAERQVRPYAVKVSTELETELKAVIKKHIEKNQEG